MISWIISLLKIAAAACGWGQQRSADNNAPDMKASAAAQTAAAIAADATKAVAAKDTAAVERGLAE